jgi:hypothetical protein
MLSLYLISAAGFFPPIYHHCNYIFFQPYRSFLGMRHNVVANIHYKGPMKREAFMHYTNNHLLIIKIAL